MEGTFITFEGPEGSFKTTQRDLLYDRLNKERYPVIKTKEPGGTPLADRIRAILLESTGHIDPKAEMFLFGASRAQHVTQVIIPFMEKGGIVLCDRFHDSTTAYQGYGRGLPLGFIGQFHDLVLEGFQPDLTLLYTCDDVEKIVQLAQWRNRQSGSKEVRFDNERAEFHQRVNAGYKIMAVSEPHRFKVINIMDGDRIRTRESIHEETYAIVKRFLDARK